MTADFHFEMSGGARSWWWCWHYFIKQQLLLGRLFLLLDECIVIGALLLMIDNRWLMIADRLLINNVCVHIVWRSIGSQSADFWSMLRWATTIRFVAFIHCASAVSGFRAAMVNSKWWECYLWVELRDDSYVECCIANTIVKIYKRNVTVCMVPCC